MCGIAGIMMKRGHALREDVLDRLRTALHHRGPNSSGLFRDGPVALVNTRLSIVDIEGGDQPLFGPDGLVLVANGEIYNAPELRAAMPGYPFRTLSDCEPMLPLYRQYGADFADHLRGMVAVAIYDPATGRLTLSRDPLGIKPLYLAEDESCIAFASEPQALIRAGLVPAALDPALRSELLQLKHVTEERTIFPGIRRVAPGETLTIEHGEITARQRLPEPGSAWRTAGQVPRLDRPALLEQLEQVLLDSTEVHLRMDADGCLFLSGGVDSSLLLKLAQQVSRKPLKALTISYGEGQRGDESEAAVRYAESLGVDCARVRMTAEDFWNHAPAVAAAIDDPTTDAAVLPTWVLARAAAARGEKVALTGEGADEVFGGYTRYRRALLPTLFPRRKQRRGVFTESGIPLDRFGDWSAGYFAVERRQRALCDTRPQLLQSIDMAERLPNSLLIKLDRCLMAHGVEGRTPFLDREVVRFACGLPDRLRVDLRWGKVLLRELLAKLAPQARPYARKRGFGVPAGRWMQDRQRELVPLVAAQPGIAAVFTRDEVARILGQAAEQEQPAWSLLFYALWHSHHLLGLRSEGDIAAVLGSAARLG
ncbi:asparagine synthase (glutamine-hydrolyzing) [Roseicella aquatilis]|nr:asparagine synthase (glutamine-hydrolyzing) [Roseicella aquatilis]